MRPAGVGYDLEEGVELARFRSINRVLTGFDGRLPDSYGLPVVALAELLNRWRDAALGISRQSLDEWVEEGEECG